MTLQKKNPKTLQSMSDASSYLGKKKDFYCNNFNACCKFHTLLGLFLFGSVTLQETESDRREEVKNGTETKVNKNTFNRVPWAPKGGPDNNESEKCNFKVIQGGEYIQEELRQIFTVIYTKQNACSQLRVTPCKGTARGWSYNTVHPFSCLFYGGKRGRESNLLQPQKDASCLLP